MRVRWIRNSTPFPALLVSQVLDEAFPSLALDATVVGHHHGDRAIAFGVTPCNPYPCLSLTTITFQFLAGTAIFSFFPMLLFLPTGPAGDVKFFARRSTNSRQYSSKSPHTPLLSSGTWGIILDIKKVALLSASLRVRSAFSCNVSPVVAASCVIAWSHFVRFSGESIVWVEVVKAICCPNPRAIQLRRNPVGSGSFAVVGKHLLRQVLSYIFGNCKIYIKDGNTKLLDIPKTNQKQG